MSSWAGFTDEELNRLKQQHGVEEERVPIKEGIKKSGINNAKRQRSREKIRARVPPHDQRPPLADNEENQGKQRSKTGLFSGNEAIADIRTNTAVHTREEERENSSPECERRGKGKQNKKTAVVVEEASKTQRDQQDSAKDGNQNGRVARKETDKDCTHKLPDIIDETERIQAIELSALEKMQEKQKQIEEENKKKKAALQEAIKQRYKRTQAEAQTLALVQKELSHLDSLLSADVAILRDKIEESSREYLNAQKRYDKAEKEFIEAKMDLHRKTERKDLLTEHLYTIIRENELRKARKLEELMAKLNVSDEALVAEQTVASVVESNVFLLEENSENSPSQTEKVDDKILEVTPEIITKEADNSGESTAKAEAEVSVEPEEHSKADKELKL